MGFTAQRARKASFSSENEICREQRNITLVCHFAKTAFAIPNNSDNQA
jgi:hypothetical protein